MSYNSTKRVLKGQQPNQRLMSTCQCKSSLLLPEHDVSRTKVLALAGRWSTLKVITQGPLQPCCYLWEQPCQGRNRCPLFFLSLLHSSTPLPTRSSLITGEQVSQNLQRATQISKEQPCSDQTLSIKVLTNSWYYPLHHSWVSTCSHWPA